MNKLWLLIGAGIGYVLGARAGRERYDQLADQANKLWTDPRVQTKVEEAKAKAPEVAHTLGEQAKAKVDEVKSKVTGHESLAADGTYENATGSYSPQDGLQVDESKLGPTDAFRPDGDAQA
ncbi:YtxH domain-containing protein [Ornithinimicrobium avium]|uniref:YtxH domain-containing protein n=1 Tax=Ornithinimicrobium avium TaxID=2283195 RepID=A0A345NMN9_9MICO|nr:YtxH domain-containing protein [Ornithinimicrobium avium]AXH96297.1 YtxH domain-containing protein [Ornithinimicrobium avium]